MEQPKAFAVAPTAGNIGPDFFCFGAQKGGTRWLFDQLDGHPDFWMPPIKELHYFNNPASRRDMAMKLQRATGKLDALNRRREKNRRRPLDQHDLAFLSDFLALSEQPLTYTGYAQLFRHARGRLSGDVTPGYSVLDDKRVAGITEHFPDAVYVFIARDPVKRFWSQVRMHVHKERLAGRLNTAKVVALLDEGRYRKRSFQSEIVARWKRFVSPDRIVLLLFDDLAVDAANLRRRVVSLLGGDPDKPSGSLPPDFNRKMGKSSVPMPEDLRRMVAARLAGEIHACAEAFGGAAKNWPAANGV
ncbi:MAG: sulfotransferase [Hyphomicrobiales bacterium]|nr:sulfotransferase [Hyphomicrobiales bacterium]